MDGIGIAVVIVLIVLIGFCVCCLRDVYCPHCCTCESSDSDAEAPPGNLINTVPQNTSLAPRDLIAPQPRRVEPFTYKEPGRVDLVPKNLQNECAVCLDQYDQGEKIRILACGHYYHKECVDPWLKQNLNGCPKCRKS